MVYIDRQRYGWKKCTISEDKKSIEICIGAQNEYELREPANGRHEKQIMFDIDDNYDIATNMHRHSCCFFICYKQVHKNRIQ